MTDFQNPFIPERIKKTISRVGYENAKGLIHRVTVTDVERLSKTVGCERSLISSAATLHRIRFIYINQLRYYAKSKNNWNSMHILRNHFAKNAFLR